MNTELTIRHDKIVKNVLIDTAGIILIYSLPAISHLLNFPLYLLEPMRIMLILAIVHTNKKNAYLIAVTLPAFSLAVSAHPVLLKTAIITAELVLNVWLYYKISELLKNKFGAMLISIALSKLIYYLMKFTLINFALIESGLISTPLYLQLAVAIVLSSYIFFMNKRQAAD